MLILKAETLAHRYASTVVYDQSLSLSDSQSAPETFKISIGKAWVASSAHSSTEAAHADDKLETSHTEADGFDGDRILANSILFLHDFSWWVEMVYAVADGDIGRAFVVLKVS